jgi:integrase
VARLQAAGLSPSRIRQARQVLSASLQSAVEAGYIGANPAAGVKTPRERPREMRFLSAEEVERVAAATPEPSDTLMLVLADGGLRWGEAVALRRSRVDVLTGRLHVAESLAEVRGELHFGTTKTHRDRAVSLPGFLRERLAHHLVTWVRPDAEALVFTTPEEAPLRHSNFRYRVWLPSLERAGPGRPSEDSQSTPHRSVVVDRRRRPPQGHPEPPRALFDHGHPRPLRPLVPG